MPVRYLSGPELARLSSWPDEIAVEDAVTYFTLSADDLSWLADFNRQHNRLGVAVQLSTLPWLGWIPDDLAGCPPIALDRLAQAFGSRTTWAGWPSRREPAGCSALRDGLGTGDLGPLWRCRTASGSGISQRGVMPQIKMPAKNDPCLR